MNPNACASFLLLAILSCTRPDSKNLILSTYIQAQVQISVDEKFSQDRTRSQYFESDSGEYLAVMNKIGPSIEMINLLEEKIVISIPIFKEGPNNVGVDNGFHIASQDCLLLASIPPKINIIDFNGNIRRKIPINNEDNPLNYLSSTNETPFLFRGDILYGAQPYFKNIYQITKSEAVNVKIFYKLDLKNNSQESVEWLPIFRPKDVWDDGKKSVDISWTDRGDSIIVSPITDHRIWIMSKKKGNLFKYIEAKSNFINSFRIIKEYPVGDEAVIENLKNGQYDLIYYDQYRDVFYRFYFVGINWEEYGISPMELNINPPKMGVLVLDENLNILGEHVFEEHYVENGNYFVGRKGLYVSTNNPNRDDFDENVLRYDIIRFEGLEYED